MQFPGATDVGGRDHRRDDPLNDRMREMAKMRNEDRQKRLVTDTDKLLEVATDLKEQVDQSTPETLSGDTMKKIDEIEKAGP